MSANLEKTERWVDKLSGKRGAYVTALLSGLLIILYAIELTEVPSKPNITIDKLAPEAERMHKFVRIAAMILYVANILFIFFDKRFVRNKNKTSNNSEPDDISYLVWESTFVKCGVAFMTFVCLLSDRYTDYIIQNMDQGMSSGFAIFILSAMFVLVFLKDLTFIRPSRSGKTKEEKDKFYTNRNKV